MLYAHNMASQEAVLHTLTGEMADQRVRSLFVAYCLLLYTGKSMTQDALDAKCEKFLHRAFGLRLDFKIENSLPSLIEWGLAVEEGGEGDEAPSLRAVPMEDALRALDAVWDGIFDYEVRGSGCCVAVWAF